MPSGLTEDRPIYIQIKEYIEGEILSGALQGDAQIPSTNQLVSYFAINPVTVLKGVSLLANEGILYKKRGVGMFVSSGAREVILNRYRELFTADLLLPMVRRAKPLGLTMDELQKRIEQVWEEA